MMWTTLEETYHQKKAGNRFNAYDTLFSIRKQDDESVQTLINRVDEALKLCQALRPQDFDITALDKELSSMVLLRALPDDYSHFVTSLLLLDKLDKATITQAFLTEETQRRRRAADALSAAALSAAALSVSSSSSSTCAFCTRSGHTQADCRAFARAQKNAREYVTSGSSHKRGQQSKKAQEKTKESAATSGVTEFAGNASAVPDLANPSSPIQPHADFRWNADSGCTSTMTPHRHWIRNYRPLRVGVELADGSIIYSAGVGTVVIDPVVDGKRIRSVELTCVLHVPQLRSNLLSCLFLTRCCGFSILIDSAFMHFMRSGMTLFRARITANNAAFIDGATRTAVESANALTTRPLDLQLWHERLCHHNTTDISKLISGGLATGISLSSSAKRDLICEPCLAGKMHSGSFPSTGNCASHPLDLVHSALCGPMSVSTPEGFRYWCIFMLKV